MITTINEWKRFNSGVNEINTDMTLNPGDRLNPLNNMTLNPGIQQVLLDDTDFVPIDNVDVDTKNNIIKAGEYAKSLGMSKQQTVEVINKVFVDPSRAPEDISVAFVQDHLGEIVAYVESLPDNEFPETTYQYTKDMEANDLPFECAMYVQQNDKIKKLAETLNTQIKKDNFKAVYENDIFFINSMDKMNDNNKKIVLSILHECNAKNISNSLKWKRKI